MGDKGRGKRDGSTRAEESPVKARTRKTTASSTRASDTRAENTRVSRRRDPSPEPRITTPRAAIRPAQAPEPLSIAQRFEAMIVRLSKDSPDLTGDEIAGKMIDWIFASSIQSRVLLVKKFPKNNALEANTIYLLKSGKYKIRHIDKKEAPYSGSLYNIGYTIPEKSNESVDSEQAARAQEPPDEIVQKLSSPDAIVRLKKRLNSLRFAKKQNTQEITDIHLILDVVKITTKIGHNPAEFANQKSVQKKCLLALHPDRQYPPAIASYLTNDARNLPANDRASDFYFRKVNHAFNLHRINPLLRFFINLPPIVEYLLLVIACFSVFTVLASLFYVLSFAVVYFMTEYGMAFATWSLAVAAQGLASHIVELVASYFVSEESSAIISYIASIAISCFLVDYFLKLDFILAGLERISRIFLNVNSILDIFGQKYTAGPLGSLTDPLMEEAYLHSNAGKRQANEFVPAPPPSVEAKSSESENANDEPSPPTNRRPAPLTPGFNAYASGDDSEPLEVILDSEDEPALSPRRCTPSGVVGYEDDVD